MYPATHESGTFNLSIRSCILRSCVRSDTDDCSLNPIQLLSDQIKIRFTMHESRFRPGSGCDRHTGAQINGATIVLAAVRRNPESLDSSRFLNPILERLRGIVGEDSFFLWFNLEFKFRAPWMQSRQKLDACSSERKPPLMTSDLDRAVQGRQTCLQSLD